jgi:hypothetical protein
MKSKKITHQTETTKVNHETGEVISTETSNTINIRSEPPYIKLYLEDIEKLYNLPNNSSTVILELLKELNYNGLIPLNSTTKKLVCEKVKYTTGSLDNYLTSLVKKDIFRKEGRGCFRPNPHLFGKGDWAKISKERTVWLKVSYKKDGTRNITSSMEASAEAKERNKDSNLGDVNLEIVNHEDGENIWIDEDPQLDLVGGGI